MSRAAAGRLELPDAVRGTLDDFRTSLGLELHLWSCGNGGRWIHLDPPDQAPSSPSEPDAHREEILPPSGPPLYLEIRGVGEERVSGLAGVIRAAVERTFELSEEVRFFTYELSERYEEINLLYSISEILGSILDLDEAARIILKEVCDVLGARRGSLWVYRAGLDHLYLVSSVGEEGLEGPLATDDGEAITARVFREGRPIVGSREEGRGTIHPDVPLDDAESYLSVPIRYTPLSGSPKTVGVINLLGRRRGGRFTASDQKLLSAIASQVGAALENNRLIRESLSQERVQREMELAHDLQMKLLPSIRNLEGLEVAARVEPAESVGGDFYHFLRLGRGRVGVMIGDVSSHGFPAALIMALSLSAASIYAAEFDSPAQVLRHLDGALRDELETTEMYLTLFYGVLDRNEGELAYANAGHPHAFLLRDEGGWERLRATDPPVGIGSVEAGFHQRRVAWDPASDLLLLFTDGLSDVLASGGGSRGEAWIRDEVQRHRDRSAGALVDHLFERAARSTPTIPADDRTAVLIRGR